MGRRADLESAISSCKAKIAELEEVLKKLGEYQERLSQDHTDMTDNIKTPVDGYDLTENDDWLGFQEALAADKLEDTCSALETYDGEVSDLEGDISDAITKVNEKLETEKENLASLEAERATCTDDD